MSGEVLGFTIWIIVGFGIMLLGIIDIFSKKPAGFWANSKPFEVKDVKGYNRATGLLFIAYGLYLIYWGYHF